MQELLDNLLTAYQEFKREVKSRDKILYERWKAGGFLVDNDIISMYPAAEKVAEKLIGDDDAEG